MYFLMELAHQWFLSFLLVPPRCHIIEQNVYSHLGVRCEDDGGRTCVFEAELCSRGHTSLEAVWEETSDGQKLPGVGMR